MTATVTRFSALVLMAILARVGVADAQSFVTFESGQVRPLALSPNGARLFAVNTPDNRLEIFDVDALDGSLTHSGSVPVGMEPVAVAARTDAEVWVINHLSDSASIVDVASVPPRVIRTVLLCDEPRDIVFAGPGGGPTFTRAFITAARRGQNCIDETGASVDPLLITEGTGRAVVQVFDATALGSSLGGTPIRVIMDRGADDTLFADTPRALARNANGSIVYAAAFHSGNQTTAITEGLVCNGGNNAAPCTVSGTTYPGGLPAPNTNFEGDPQPEVGLIVKFNPASGTWEDRFVDLNPPPPTPTLSPRDWSAAVRFSLPDQDVFAINATTNPPAQTSAFSGVGTVIFNMAVNPVSGKVYVSNSEARNEVRFEGPGTFGCSVPPCTVQGHLHESRVTVLSGATVTPRHLNTHIDYDVVPSPGGVKDDSLAIPLAIAVTSNAGDQTVYVTAFGSSKVGVFSAAALENGTFVPDSGDYIAVTGGGPSGLVLNEPRNRLYVFTRFDNSISVVNTVTRQQIDHLPVYNPEPDSVEDGRPVLYDAMLTSSNGEASCAACHVFGDFDSLAWDLGNPDDSPLTNQNPFEFGTPEPFDPLKGPMTTQSLRGMAKHGPMHWRGDRTGGLDEPSVQPDGGAFDEDLAFKKFIVAFEGLLGRQAEISAGDMDRFTDFILQVTYPPNPIRALTNSLSASQQAGRNKYFETCTQVGQPGCTDTVRNCNGCHALDPAAGFFGGDGEMSFEGETQLFKVPHLRNMYQKVGMFGMPQVGTAFKVPAGGPTTNQGPQVRGFGFLHDGSVDTINRFHNASVFTLNATEARDMEQFMFAFDSNLAPIVGQQITLKDVAGDSNAAVVNPRINLMIQRAAANPVECNVVVKGTIGGVQRGAHRLANGTFQRDRNSESTLTDAQVRALATVAGQELTYTCVPPGSGLRIGVDRDEDGFFDRTELDAGSDPADPLSVPSSGTTTTTSTSSTTTITTTTTTTLPPAFVEVRTSSMKLKDDSIAPINLTARRFRFRSSSRDGRIVAPVPGSSGDPTAVGALLTVYNSAGGSDIVTLPLAPSLWTQTGSSTNPRYRFRDTTPGAPISRITVKASMIRVKGGKENWTYTLNELAQGSIAVRLQLGSGTTWCANAVAPRVDVQDRFVAVQNTPAPGSCPPTP